MKVVPEPPPSFSIASPTSSKSPRKVCDWKVQ